MVLVVEYRLDSPLDPLVKTYVLAAVCGWDTLAMVQKYTKAASQKRLAKAAISKLPTKK